MKTMMLASALAMIVGVAAFPGAAQAAPAQVKMSIDENPVVPYLAKSLGYLDAEGIEIVPVVAKDHLEQDYQFQKLLEEGKIDIAYHWFNHTIFGARNGHPIKAVMMINDAPAMQMLAAKQRAGDLRSAADLKGANVAEGASYGVKSALTNYLARKAGLPANSYNSVIKEVAGRQKAVVEGLQAGKVDVVTAQEPLISVLKKEGLVKVMYDMSSGPATEKVFGTSWPAQSLLVSQKYLDQNPKAVQGVVNAYVKTLRFMASHSAEEIAARLPAEYFEGKDRAEEMEYLRVTLPSYASQNYRFESDAVSLVADLIRMADFDSSPAGQWRAKGRHDPIDVQALYDNRFVDRASQDYPANGAVDTLSSR